MKTVYFDRNVFDHICTLNCGVTEEDVAKIQGAIHAGAINIPASYLVIEETVPIIRISEEKYEQHIRTVLNRTCAAQLVRQLQVSYHMIRRSL
jgi:hypothetical protein